MLTINNDHFELNGKNFTIYSGAMHYFRTLPEYWKDRLTKLKSAGFNTVETYVCWNLHEPQKGVFDFNGMLDLVQFLKTAQEIGLYAIVRPGPYICAEWDFGGLPAWLLKDQNIRLRCSNPAYMSHVSDFYHELLQRLAPMQITNGGNIIAMQIENEYGSYGNDKTYLEFIKDLMLECGVDVLLFTSDGNWNNMLSGGGLPGVLKTLNFGGGAKNAFKALAPFTEKSPKMCMEFWCGWFDHWGDKHHTRGYKSVLNEIQDFIAQDASFNFYMFHGGTNFGCTAGANHGKGYEPTVTSYDYCALLTEWGDYTPAYHAVREILCNKQGLELKPLPNRPKLQNIGKVNFTQSAPLMPQIPVLGRKHHSPVPESMEYYGQNFGMIYYETILKGNYSLSMLDIKGVHDFAYLYIDGQQKAQISRMDQGKRLTAFKNKKKLMINAFEGEKKIGVLVDTMGRVNYGDQLYDRKGITGLSIGNQLIMEYDVYTLPLDHLDKVSYDQNTSAQCPAFFKGSFSAGQGDCFIHMDGFKKGYVFVNGFNLGRYWDIGPQKALYLPGVLLKEKNEIVVLEMECFKNPFVTITDQPALG